MGREVTTHKGNLLNNSLTIGVLGEPGPGGAPNRYEIFRNSPGAMNPVYADLRFHCGNPADGITGLSNEALLAVLIDRMQGFQSGPFRCISNAQSLKHLECAMEIFKERTSERTARGVEGTQEV